MRFDYAALRRTRQTVAHARDMTWRCMETPYLNFRLRFVHLLENQAGYCGSKSLAVESQAFWEHILLKLLLLV